jgi:hypothetical protein
MNVAAIYLLNAEECLARSAKLSGAEKDKLLRLAAAWCELAEEELRPKKEHPALPLVGGAPGRIGRSS